MPRNSAKELIDYLLTEPSLRSRFQGKDLSLDNVYTVLAEMEAANQLSPARAKAARAWITGLKAVEAKVGAVQDRAGTFVGMPTVSREVDLSGFAQREVSFPGNPPPAEAPFEPSLPGLRKPIQLSRHGNQSVPLPKWLRKERKVQGRLSSILGASGVEGEGSALQRGAARLAQSVGAEGAVLGGGGKISGLLGSLARGAIKHPIVGAIDAVGLGLPLLGLAKDAANAVSRSVTGDPLIGGISTDQALAMEAEVRKEQRRREIENQARAQRLAQNTVSLIQNAPLVAQQIMAGRRLPKGAVVIGGTPRVDLMQQMADQMSQGQFQNQDPLQQLTTEV